jgi:simple sugar transport system permease protein
VKPELGALVGAVVVFAFFAAQSPVFRSARGIANWLDPASTLGIMAVAVALLMIGGHFDLSAGVMTGTTALTVGVLAGEFGQNIWSSRWRSGCSTAGWSPAPACRASSSRSAPS